MPNEASDKNTCPWNPQLLGIAKSVILTDVLRNS